MKIQCNVCETAEAVVLCCADEAALCFNCDEKVHAANKLASKHQRIPLFHSNSDMPKCDICQEAAGYFFCLEDRALLCRKCDVAIHTVNSLVSSHQRFLLTGVKVGIESVDPSASSSTRKSSSVEKIPESHSVPGRTVTMSETSRFNKVMPVDVAAGGDFVPHKLPLSEGTSADTMQQWQFDDFLSLTDFNQNYNYLENGSPKADYGKLEAVEVELGSEDFLGQVPDTSWAVPQVYSPPPASGLRWPKVNQRPARSDTFVPDLYNVPVPNLYGSQENDTGMLKRRRSF